MKRRYFVTLIGAAAAWPIAARAQQSKLPTIGILVSANPEPFWGELRAGLRDQGYIEGQNIAFEFRSADGNPDRLRGLADELVRLKVDVIVAQLTPAATAARQATTAIPIVMAWAGDPIGTGLISSLARPGGNVTGLSGASTELYAKTFELVRALLPSARHVAALANPADPFSRPFIEQIEEAGRVLGMSIQTIRIRGMEDFDTAFSAMVNERAEAVIVQASLPRKPILELALNHRVPVIGTNRILAQDGALMSYSINQNDMYRRAASYVDRILKGAKPADLPVEQPTRYELVVNLKTAKTLGITVPPTLLATADEVIE